MTGLLLRRALHRDRVLVAAWVSLLVVVVYSSAAATDSLYPSAAARTAAAEAIDASPAVVALYGPILDVTSLGELSTTKLTVLYAAFVALLAVVIVRRHTRAEEESGRAELLLSTAVEARAPLVVAVLEAGLVVTATGLLAAVAATAGGLPAAGSLLFGASWAGLGLVATSLTALACQLSASARTCTALVGVALGGTYVLRALGDTTVPWLGWLSPFGWGTRLRAWSDPRPAVLLLYAATAGLLLLAALALRSRRDLGAGVVAARPGPARGGSRLGGALALSARLHGPSLLAWSVATLLVGLVLGSITPAVGDLLDSPSARAMIERLGGTGALQDTLVAAELSLVAVVVTCFAVTVVTHAAGDEEAGRSAEVLATASSRAHVFTAVLVVGIAGATWLLALAGLALALGAGTAPVGVVTAALVQAPAVWLVTALGVAAHAIGARWAVVGWALVAGFLTLGQLGELLRLPGWLVDLSPYTHVPRMPVEGFAATPTLVLTLLAALVLAVSWLRYRSRDVG